MDTIRFETTVGDDHVIHAPEGITIPTGRVEVTVLAREAKQAADPSEPPSPEDVARSREWLLAWAKKMEELDPELPLDLAANHDFYAHGKPRE